MFVRLWENCEKCSFGHSLVIVWRINLRGMVAFPTRIHLHIVYFCNTACLPAAAAQCSRGAAAYCQWRHGGGGVSFLAKVSFIANCAATTHNVNPQITKPKNLYLVSCFGVWMYIISRVHTKLKIMINFPFLHCLFCRHYMLHCSDYKRTWVDFRNYWYIPMDFFFTIERNIVKARKYSNAT